MHVLRMQSRSVSHLAGLAGAGAQLRVQRALDIQGRTIAVQADAVVGYLLLDSLFLSF